MNSLDTNQTNTRERDLEEEEEERERGRDKAGVWPSCLSCLTLRPLSSDRRTSLCFVPPLVSVALWPGEAGKLVTLGAEGGEGVDPRPQLPVGPFT